GAATALMGSVLRVTHGRAGAATHVGRQLRFLLAQLGPTFVKVGQVVATRRDLMPTRICDELEQLQAAAEPMSDRDRRRALGQAYGEDLTRHFQRVDEVAVAAGSVACVYRAKARDGSELALKLRRPGIDRAMRLDLRLVRAVAGLMARLPSFQGVPVVEVVDHACTAVYEQLDFGREADNLERLRVNLSVVPRVWVPKVAHELSRPTCIAMEFIPGLDVRAADHCTTAERRRLAAGALGAVYRMLFVNGFVHCDLHPGNLYFTANGHVVVLDAGFSVQLTERLRILFLNFFMNMSANQGTRCAEIVLESAVGLTPRADVEAFKVAMADLVHRSSGLTAREFSLIAFAAEMFDIQRHHGVRAAPELVFPLLSLLVIEGTIRELNPEVDFQKVAEPILLEGKFRVT
ncbi:MAG: AarF/UbiB family protein, partial [Pseudomonadota bacterium]